MLGKFTQFSLSTVVTQFIILLGSLGAAVLTARVLGPEGKGTLTLLLLIPTLAVTLGRMGVGHAVNYFSGKESPTKIIVNSFLLSSFIGILLSLSLPLLLYVLKDSFFKNINLFLLIFMSLTVPLFLYSNLFTFLAQGFYKFNLRNILLLGESFTKLTLLVLLLKIFKFGVTGAVVASIIAMILLVASLGFYLLKEVNFEETKIDFQFISQLLIFGAKSHIGNVLKDLSYRGDILIVSYFLSSRFVGYYIIAVTMAEIIWKIPDAIGNVLLARVSRMNKEDAADFTPKVCRRLIPVILCLCLISVLVSDPLITFVFGPDYQPSAAAFSWLVPGVLAFAVWKILANDLIAQGYPMQYSLTSGIALVVMLGLDLWLIPAWGINGASLASTISYTLATIAIMIVYRQITQNSLKSLLIPLKSDYFFYKKVAGSLTTLRWRALVKETCSKPTKL